MIASADNSRASLLARIIGKKEHKELADTILFHYATRVTALSRVAMTI
jgi:hypothetical protein